MMLVDYFLFLLVASEIIITHVTIILVNPDNKYVFRDSYLISFFREITNLKQRD